MKMYLLFSIKKRIVNFMIGRVLRKFVKPIIKDVHGFHRTVHWVVENQKAIKRLVSAHGKELNNDFLGKKQSEVLFILGSGPSINNISKKQWSVIRENDSLGFNYWAVHNFVPSFYMFQPGNDSNSYDLGRVLSDRKTDYAQVPVIIRGNGMADGTLDYTDERFGFLKSLEVFYLKEYFIHPNCAIKPDQMFSYAEALGMLKYGSVTDFIPKWKTTLGLLLSLSYEMGYEKVVLCGMDMKDSSHFWDSPEYEERQEHYKLPKPGMANIPTFTDKRVSPYTMIDYVSEFNDWAGRRANFQLFIANDQTLLHPHLAVFFD